MPRVPRPFLWRDGWYTDFGGRRQKLAPRTLPRREAEKLLADLIRRDEETRGDGVGVPGVRLTVAVLIDYYLDAVKIGRSEATYRLARLALGLLRERHGVRLCRDFSSIHALSLYKELRERTGPGGQPLKANSLNTYTTSWKKCWRWGLKNRLIRGDNPFDSLQRVPTEHRRRTITGSEFYRLCRAANRAMRHLLIALRYTPARPGELMRTTWEDIDWQSGVIRLSKHKTSTTTKVKKDRLIPITPVLRLVLKRREMFRSKGEGAVYPFTTIQGKKWDTHNAALLLRCLRKKVGIRADHQGEELVLYSNRHTFITEAARNGATGPELQMLGDWAGQGMLGVYVHLDNQDLHRAAAKGFRRLTGQDGEEKKS